MKETTGLCTSHRLTRFYLLIGLTLVGGSACGVRRIVTDPPTIAFQTEAYIVIQTAPDDFTILTRSNAALDEVTRQLGCTKNRVCSRWRDGEVWTIQRKN
jgi:hypothetical protein